SDKKVAFALTRELHWPLQSRRFATVFLTESLELSPEAAAMKRRLTPSLIPIRIVTFVVALACALALMGPHLSRPLSAQSKATATNVPVIPHEAVPNFFKNPPGIYTGENMGISTNSKGQIYIYHRAYETRLFEYSPQGTFVREIGRNN